MISNKFVEKFSKKKNRNYDEDDGPMTVKKFKSKNKKPQRFNDEEDYEYPRNTKKTNRRD